MDSAQALADLTEISSQIRAAVLIAEDGAVAGATLGDEAAKRMAEAATELLAAAERTRPGLGPGALTQLEIATTEGSVFVVRDHGRVICATTSPEPTVGLVFYDLKSCLKSAGEEERPAPAGAKPRRKAAEPKEPEAAEAPPKRTRKRTTAKDDAAS